MISRRDSNPDKPIIPKWVVPGTLIFFVVIFALSFIPRKPAFSAWNLAEGTVLGTRIQVVGLIEAGEAHPAMIYYMGEAQVTYEADGKQYKEWLPATDKSSSREWLNFTLSRRSNSVAEVLWNPTNPAQARATLHYKPY